MMHLLNNTMRRLEPLVNKTLLRLRPQNVHVFLALLLSLWAKVGQGAKSYKLCPHDYVVMLRDGRKPNGCIPCCDAIKHDITPNMEDISKEEFTRRLTEGPAKRRSRAPPMPNKPLHADPPCPTISKPLPPNPEDYHQTQHVPASRRPSNTGSDRPHPQKKQRKQSLDNTCALEVGDVVAVRTMNGDWKNPDDIIGLATIIQLNHQTKEVCIEDHLDNLQIWVDLINVQFREKPSHSAQSYQEHHFVCKLCKSCFPNCPYTSGHTRGECWDGACECIREGDLVQVLRKGLTWGKDQVDSGDSDIVAEGKYLGEYYEVQCIKCENNLLISDTEHARMKQGTSLTTCNECSYVRGNVAVSTCPKCKSTEWVEEKPKQCPTCGQAGDWWTAMCTVLVTYAAPGADGKVGEEIEYASGRVQRCYGASFALEGYTPPQHLSEDDVQWAREQQPPQSGQPQARGRSEGFCLHGEDDPANCEICNGTYAKKFRARGTSSRGRRRRLADINNAADKLHRRQLAALRARASTN